MRLIPIRWAGNWQHDIQIPSPVQAGAFLGYTFSGKLDARVNLKNFTDRGGYVMNHAFQPNPPRCVYVMPNDAGRVRVGFVNDITAIGGGHIQKTGRLSGRLESNHG